ncbi:MAG: hypothetical protein WDZ45_01280 [Flavobacteriaceae bacterium]
MKTLKTLLLSTTLIITSLSGTAQDANILFGAGTITGDRSENYDMTYFFDFQYSILQETIGNKGYQNSNIHGYLVGGIRYLSIKSEAELDNNEPTLSWYFTPGVALNYNFKKLFIGFQVCWAGDISKGAFDENNQDRPDMSGWQLSPRIGVELFKSFNFVLSYENIHVNKKPFESFNAGFVVEL